MLEPRDAGGSWVRRNQHLAVDFPAVVLGFFGMLRGLSSFHGTCKAREIKGQGQLMAPSQLRRYPKYRTVAARRKCNFN